MYIKAARRTFYVCGLQWFLYCKKTLITTSARLLPQM